MKTFGPLYVGKLNYYHRKPLPIIEIGKTQETDMPYRTGRCLVFRAPFTIPGYYVGLLFNTVKDPEWLTEEEIDDIMVKAMRARTDEEGVARVREK